MAIERGTVPEQPGPVKRAPAHQNKSADVTFFFFFTSRRRPQVQWGRRASRRAGGNGVRNRKVAVSLVVDNGVVLLLWYEWPRFVNKPHRQQDWVVEMSLLGAVQ